MELKHSFTVPTSVDQAWDLFMDLERVGGCFPGATVTDVSEEKFTGTVKVKLGPIALLYAGSGSFLEKDESARRAVIEAQGKDKRGNGTAGATVTIQLAEDGGGTRADVQTDLAITGKPAQFGRGVMQDVSDKLLGQFVACIERQFAAEQAAPEAVVAAAPSAAAAPAPAKKAAAKQVAGPPAKKAAAKKAAGPPAKKAAAPPPAPVAPAAPRPTEQLGDTEVDEGAISVTEQQGGGTAGPRVAAAASSAPYRPVEEDAIDLGATVLPVLARRYAGFAVAGFVGFLIGWLLGRRRSRD